MHTELMLAVTGKDAYGYDAKSFVPQPAVEVNGHMGVL